MKGKKKKDQVCGSPTTDTFKKINKNVQVISVEQKKTLGNAHIENPCWNQLKHGFYMCV